jgi:hypothetical protein
VTDVDSAQESSEAVRLVVPQVSDAPSLQGREFLTDWFQVEPEKLALFDSATYSDISPHEVDLTAYPDDLVEGYHLVALLDYLVNHVLYVEGPWVAWNYGMDRVRFVSPTRARDRWRLRGTVDEVIERSGGFLLRLSITSEVQGREKPGFVVEQRVLWREGAAS